MQIDRVTKKDEAIIKILFYWFNVKKKSWGLISQKWMLETVERIHGITMSRRTLNRCLARLRDLGIVYTEQRHRRDPKSGEFCPEVSIYYMTDELKRYVNKVFKFFKNLFGFGDLTEYTVNVTPYQPRPVIQPKPKTDPPDKHSPNRTNWQILGRARA